MQEFRVPLSGVLQTPAAAAAAAEASGDSSSNDRQSITAYMLTTRMDARAGEDDDALLEALDGQTQRTAAATATIGAVEKGCRSSLRSSALGVVDPDNFDVLYSVAADFAVAPPDAKQALVHAAIDGLRAVLQATKQFVAQKDRHAPAAPRGASSHHANSDNDDDDDESSSGPGALGGDLSATYRSAIKMYAFLLVTLIQQQEKAAKDQLAGSAHADDDEAAAPVKGRKKAVGKAKKGASASGSSGSFDWSMQKEKAIGGLVDLLSERAMYSLWRMSSPEEEFGGMILAAAMALLEQPENAKSKGVKEASFALLAHCLHKFPTLQSRATQQIVHALQHCEALAQPLAEALSAGLAAPFKLHQLLREVLAEIAELDGAMLSKDASGARALSSFLVLLASQSPRAMLSNLPALESQLEAESYVIRNGCVQALGQLIESLDQLAAKERSEDDHKSKKKSQLGEDDEAAEAAEKAEAGSDVVAAGPEARARMVATLLARIHDVNSFTRTKTLQQLLSLVRSKSLPNPAAHVATVRAAADRLMDKTGAVRRAAIQLLAALMEMNPFSPVLSLDLFQKRLHDKMVAFRSQLEPAPKRPADASRSTKDENGDETEEDDEVKSLDDDCKEDAAPASGAALSTEQSVKALLSSVVVSDLALEKSRVEIESLFHAVTFIQSLVSVVPVLGEMFLSKTATDATECVAFFVVAKEFGLAAPAHDDQAEVAGDNAAANVHRAVLTVDGACKKMAGLIWSREAGTRDAVLAAWQRLYLHPDLQAPRGSPQQKKAALVSVHALLGLVLTSNLSELTSLEEILTKLYYAGAVPTVMVDSAWELFAGDSSSSTVRAALLTLLNYFANANGEVLSAHAQELVEVGLSGAALTSAPHLVRATCVALQKWQAAVRAAATPAQAPPALSEKTLGVICQRFEVLLLHSATCAPRAAQAWYTMAEQVLNTVFALHSTPERFTERVLQQLAPTIFSPSGEAGIGNAEKLSRFLFLLSHAAMRTLVHLEALEKDIRALKAKAAARAAGPQIETERIGLESDDEKEAAPKKKKAAPAKSKAKKKKKGDSSEEDEEVASEDEEASEEEKPAPKKRAAKKSAVAAPATDGPSSIEDELASSAAAEYELEQRREFAEQRLIESSATANGLLSVFGPIVEQIVLSLVPGPTLGRYAAHAHLQVNGVFALCKFMAINVEYCESHLRLLFSALTSPTTDATIKGNIIIALGDLFLRFPNSIEPYSEYMYHGLKKTAPRAANPKSRKATAPPPSATAASLLDEVYVRKNTLMVLTHLILNDMLKAKGPIAELAKCTQDFTSHPRIGELSQCFFQELSNKTGDSKATIYNILPDILSRLSADATVTEQHFQAIFKFLLGFINKDKQIENLIEKLINRFEFVYVEPPAPEIDTIVPAPQDSVADQSGALSEGEPGVAPSSAPAASSSSAAAPAEQQAPTQQSMSLKQCRDLSYCLTQLPFSLASLKKLSQLFRCYASKLGDQVVRDQFVSIIARVRKGISTAGSKEAASGSASSALKEKDAPELKALCDELDAKYAAAHEKLVEEARVTAKARSARGKKGYGERLLGEEVEEEEDEHKAASVSAPTATSTRRPARSAKAAPVAKKPVVKARGGRRNAADDSPDEVSESSSEEEDASEVSELGEEEAAPVRKSRSARAPVAKKAPAKTARRKKIADSEEDDE